MWCSAPGRPAGRRRRSLSLWSAIGLLGLLAGCVTRPVLYDHDEDGSPDSEDCAPTDPAVHPGAADRVDEAGVDNDCDGLDGVDADGDGHASVESGGGDCNDDVVGVHPDAAEVPDDGLDNDCVGGDATCDADGDGVQAPVCDGDDCDDFNSLFFPGAQELCDGIDGNCDGAVADQELDADADGVRGCEGDCDDSDPAVAPGSPEICDGLDDDCDAALPIDEVDGDGDGVAPCGGDCDDDDPTRHPGAEEVCDGLDDDCDGAAGPDEGDADGDGDPACSDCHDGDPDRDELDLDGDGFSTCAGDCDDDALAVRPGGVDAWGDGTDGNCDGVDGLDADGDEWPVNGVPPDCDDDPGSPSATETWPGAPDAVGDDVDEDCDGVDGVDGDGDGLASIGSGGADCNDDPADPIAAQTFPGADDSVGNGVDTNCDGVDGVDGDGDEVAWVGSGGTDCDDEAPATWPGAPDTVGDAVDQGCDGVDGVDADGDGVASEASGGADCNDDPADPLAYTTFPGADDAVGNGVDTDCDTVDGVDGDGDGQASTGSGGQDCNDDSSDALATATWLGAPDDVGDELDQNCDGVDGVDADGDGVASEASGGADCSDDPAVTAAASIFPGVGDAWGDSVDTNCDGVDGFDADGDGWAANAGDGQPDCDDGDPGIYPGAIAGWESPATGLDRDCDGEVYDAVSEAWSAWVGEAAADRSGDRLALAGDVDGDGLADLLIGAQDNDQAAPRAGKTYLVYGSTISAGGTLGLAQADVALLGQSVDDRSPDSLASAGDVDGDGLDDILVGVLGRGETYLFFGASLPASGTLSLAAADALFVQEDNGDLAGISAASAGDVDGDGLDDLLIGAVGNDEGGYNAGKAYVVFGSSIGSGGTFALADADVGLVGEGNGIRAGWVAPAGDVDGDGLDDVLVGAPWASAAEVECGKTFVWFGSTLAAGGTFWSSTSDAVLVGEGAGDHAGRTLSPAGDVDGDGQDDVLVGAPENDDAGADAGKAYLLLGPTLSAGGTISLGSADAWLVGEGAGDEASERLAAAGDVDGDGLDDVLIGAPHGLGDQGKVYLLLGATLSAGGVFDLGLSDAAFAGEGADHAAGSGLAGGDVDGDGLSDLMIGAYGAAFTGNNSGKTYILLSPF
jgi:hypothetical protein